jgi:hypothetical protein
MILGWLNEEGGGGEGRTFLSVTVVDDKACKILARKSG